MLFVELKHQNLMLQLIIGNCQRFLEDLVKLGRCHLLKKEFYFQWTAQWTTNKPGRNNDISSVLIIQTQETHQTFLPWIIQASLVQIICGRIFCKSYFCNWVVPKCLILRNISLGMARFPQNLRNYFCECRAFGTFSGWANEYFFNIASRNIYIFRWSFKMNRSTRYWFDKHLFLKYIYVMTMTYVKYNDICKNFLANNLYP